MLVILVVQDGARWLRPCLRGLADQTHSRLGILAVDNSSDGSAQLLEAALGRDRVDRVDRTVGFSGAVARALTSEPARQADYVLLLHDDTRLDPGAVAAMVEAAERVENVGVVGPKVVDWDQPRVLLEIGLSTDRFGYPYSPLEDGEIDQGQYDRIREVLFVSSCAMLVSREAWSRIGPPDERLSPASDDLDFCWRARLAGYRVLMTPKAVARHRATLDRGERGIDGGSGRMRYHRERVALASILKNYGLLSLAWVLPLYLLQGMIRLGILGLTRRFQDAYQVLAAWAWNVVHLPGTVRRRVRAQAVRRVPDRSVRRSMAPAWVRLRRWAQSAGQTLLPRAEPDDEAAGTGPRRLLHTARNHPAATAWSLGLLVAVVAYRDLFRIPVLTGGGLGAFPHAPSAFFRELVSGLRHTGLGGSQAASPALGVLGLGSTIALGSPAVLEKLLLLGLPAVAAASCYRTVRTATGQILPAAVSAACYGLSSLVLWGVSEGRIPALVLVAGMPWLAGKLWEPFDPEFRVPVGRWLAGAGLGLSVLGSFFPGALLAVMVVVAAGAVTPRSGVGRRRGVALGVLAAAAAALLALPLTLELIGAGGAGLVDHAGQARFGALARLSLGSGPGEWPTGYFLPAAAAMGLAFVSRASRRTAARAAAAVIISLYLAWLAGAGYLPRALSDPAAYVAVAGFGMALLVGMGLADLLHGVSEAAFGHRQLAAGTMAMVLTVGLGAQAVQAAGGSWTVGGSDRTPPAYGLVQQPPFDYRVLWLGAPRGDAFPAPGGLPDGVVAAGSASVRYGVRSPEGATALDIGRPASGPGYARLERTLSRLLDGGTRHGGALLAPFGIRFVVASSDDLPTPVYRQLVRQVDLDQIPTEGLVVFRDQKAAPLAAVVGGEEWPRAAEAADTLSIEMLPRPQVGSALTQASDEGFTGRETSGPALVYLAQQFDARWRLVPRTGPQARPIRAFGWAVGFPAGTMTGDFRVRFGGQASRTAVVAVLMVLWAIALWLTRRPVRGG